MSSEETEEPEVYETSDVESLDYVTTTNTANVLDDDQSPDIVSTPIGEKLKESDSFFQKSYITKSRNVDFSDNIAKDGSSYGTYMVEETYEAKINRIKQELEELELLSNTSVRGAKPQPSDEIDSSAVEKLVSRLNLLQVSNSRMMGYGDGLKLENSDIAPVSVSRGSEMVPNDKVLELENRIHVLEKMVGFEDIQNYTNPADANSKVPSLEFLINDINRKIQLLFSIEDGSFDELEDYSTLSVKDDTKSSKSELDDLIQKMETINKQILFNKKKNATVSSSDDENTVTETDKVHELYARIQNIPNTSMQALVKRLESLNSAHLKVEGTTHLGENLDKILSEISGDYKNWNDALNKVSEKLQHVQKDLDANTQEIKQWVKDLS